MRLCRVVAALSGLAAALAAPAARADRTVLVVGGELSRSEGSAVQSAASRAADAAGWSAIDAGLSPSAAAELLACINRDLDRRGGCLAGLFQRAQVDRALVLRATSTTNAGARYRVLSAWVFRRSGNILAFEQRFCDRCQEAKLAQTAQFVVGLAIQNARSEAAPALLAIRSTPPGARIILDDKPVGATDMEFQVYPGRHVVRFEKDGFVISTREVSIDDGEHATIAVTLEEETPTAEKPAPVEKSAPAEKPAPAAERRAPRETPGPRETPAPAEPRPAAGSKSRVVAWALVGAGAAALAAGGVLLAIDQDYAYDEATRRKAEFRDTAPYGVGAAGAGALAIGAGVFLLLRRSPESPAPVVSLDRAAPWVGVRGAF